MFFFLLAQLGSSGIGSPTLVRLAFVDRKIVAFDQNKQFWDVPSGGCFGSLAEVHERTTRTTAMGREPAARCSIFDSKILNVCLYPERSFRSLEY